MKIDVMQFYRDKFGNIEYCAKCTHCTMDCKQSFRVQIHSCKSYIDGRKNGEQVHCRTNV